MDKNVNDLAGALTAEHLALQACNRGSHRQAADLYLQAGRLYQAAGEPVRAAFCGGNAEAELRWMRPTAPVNTAGLVD